MVDGKELVFRAIETQRLYNELLMAVERKFPGESRHETALRYIKEAEARVSQLCETKEVK